MLLLEMVLAVICYWHEAWWHPLYTSGTVLATAGLLMLKYAGGCESKITTRCHTMQ
jgi:hypothetical protein